MWIEGLAEPLPLVRFSSKYDCVENIHRSPSSDRDRSTAYLQLLAVVVLEGIFSVGRECHEYIETDWVPFFEQGEKKKENYLCAFLIRLIDHHQQISFLRE